MSTMSTRTMTSAGAGRWVATDVAYGEIAGREVGVAAAVVFEGWDAAAPSEEHTAIVRDLEPYVSGRFFRRELPCLLAVLGRIAKPIEGVLVDGYVWLAPGQHGLGAELHRALGGEVVVVGLAKTPFRSSESVSHAAHRGIGGRPLLVTAAGMDAACAARRVEAMHGAHRLPTLVQRADRLGRDALARLRRQRDVYVEPVAGHPSHEM